jgi:murein L,D-transpeptidase YcbB/YkuD
VTYEQAESPPRSYLADVRLPLPFAVLAFAALAADAQPTPRDVIFKTITSGATTVAGERICAAAPLRTFYARRDYAPAWDAENLAALLRAIDGARNDGLDPNDYHRAVWSAAAMPPISSGDILATDAFCLLGAHLGQGRVEPELLLPAWCVEPRLDLAAVLQSALDTHTVEATMARLAPRHESYRRLRDALAEVRRIEQGGGWGTLPPGKALRRGDRNARVAALRERLRIEAGDSSPSSQSNEVFDDALDAAVRDFQAHHGLAVDGVVGNATRRELDVPVAARIEQLIVNLERWRWMPDDLGASHVVVNIAAFHLDVVENGRTILSMKTVVGTEAKRTPFFAARITDVVVNPPWNVPDSIAPELWPKQQRDRGFFAREHIEITRDGRLRQAPGPWNSLGRLKFNMPNRFDVYLHDTPAKALFDLDVRAFSHGCIRVERPLDLAAYLLRMPAESIQKAIIEGKERSIPLPAAVPVYVLYWTAWIGDDGRIAFHRDVYDRDGAVARALRR